MRYLGIFLLFIAASCSDQAGTRLQPSFAPSDGLKMYLCDQYGYLVQKEEIFSSGEQIPGPSGLIINTSVFLDISVKFIDGKSVEDLMPFFREHPNLLPVLMVNIDKSLYVRLWTGEFDDRIKRLAEFIQSMDRPIYIAVGVDVNHPVYANEPNDYTKSYRYFVDELCTHEVPTATFIWPLVGMSPGYQGKDPMEWYPGDQYVNWLGTSMHKITEAHYAVKVQFDKPNFDRLLEIARAQDLPIMVLESSPASVIKNFGYSGDDLWSFWYDPFFDFVEKNTEVKAISHLFPDDIPLDTVILKKWKEQISQDRYLFAGEFPE